MCVSVMMCLRVSVIFKRERQREREGEGIVMLCVIVKILVI